MENAITITNLTKTFKDFTAVDNLSFVVPKNKIVGFLGPNGAGKTTTIRMLVGLSKPTRGDIFLSGQKITFGQPLTNKIVGYLPEQPSFYNWMTGREYLNYIADIFSLGSATKQAQITKLLGLVNLTDAAAKRIGTYSAGMKQRLGIAQALINNPQILILDEAVSALDPLGRREVLNIIDNLKKDVTIFMSTHILSDVDRVCDEVIIINKGKIVVTSPLAELKEKYAQPILEVEFDRDPAKLVSLLKAESWVKKITQTGNSLKIWPNGLSAIDQNLPLKFFARSDIAVLKYGLNLPETEDLFLNLIGEKS